MLADTDVFQTAAGVGAAREFLLRVLLAEDDPVSRRVLEAFLEKWGYEVVTADDGAEAWRILQHDDAPRLVILDCMMRRIDGLEICRRVRQRSPGPYIYILLLTARSDKQDIVKGLDEGADDYVAKPFDTAELKGRLRSGERILNLYHRLISAQESLRVQATRDSLTGLWNRREILEILRREFERAQREASCLGVVMADVDYFKQINDRYGHLVGDTVLAEVASRLLRATRPYDSLGRYGGEEFLIIVPGCDLQSASRQAERLRKSVCAQVIAAGKASISASLSLGVSTLSETRISGYLPLLKAADAALYRAKENGRNCVEVAANLQTETKNTGHP